jgi:hypothetical protein
MLFTKCFALLFCWLRQHAAEDKRTLSSLALFSEHHSTACVYVIINHRLWFHLWCSCHFTWGACSSCSVATWCHVYHALFLEAVNKWNVLIWSLPSSVYEEFSFLTHNTALSGESQPTFHRNILPPPSGSKNKLCKKPTSNRQQAELWDITLYSLVKVIQHFTGINCFHLQSQGVN